MNPYAMFKTNAAAEADQGIALDYGSFSIRIVRAGGSNKRYGQELTRRLKPYRRQIDNETLDNAVAEKVMAGLYADTVVIGWDGVTDETDASLPFTRDNCIKLFTDLPELFRDVQEQAGKVGNFRLEEQEDDAKNSNSSSATN